MDVLEVVVRFTNAVGISQPSTAVGNPTDEVKQIVELINQEGRALSRRAKWQALTFEGSFTTVATESQGTLASIIGATHQLRGIVNETIWNRSLSTPVYGPLTQRDWTARKAMSNTGPFAQYRIRGGEIIFNPVPAAGNSCYFEFISKCWCSDVNGVNFMTNVASDTDLFLLDDEIILAGLEWRWLKKKGLSYAQEFDTYEQLVADSIGRDATKPVLHMDNCPEMFRHGTYVPVGSWPLP